MIAEQTLEPETQPEPAVNVGGNGNGRVKQRTLEAISHAEGPRVSEHGRLALAHNLPDPEAYIRQNEPDITAGQRLEEDQMLNDLEAQLKSIEADTRNVFVVGDYADHYTMMERLFIALSGRINARLQGLYETRVQNNVSIRAANAKVKQIEGDVKAYTGLHQAAVKQRDQYADQIDQLATTIMEDKIIMQSYNDAITELRDETLQEKMEEQRQAFEEGDTDKANIAGKAIRDIKSDIRHYEDKRTEKALAIQTNSAMMKRKQMRHAKADVLVSKYFEIQTGLRQDMVYIQDAVADSLKYDTPIKIKDGVLAVRDTHSIAARQEKVDTDALGVLQRIPDIGTNPTPSSQETLTEVTQRMDSIRRTNGQTMYERALEAAADTARTVYQQP